MMSIRESIQELFTPTRRLHPGVYSYQAPPSDPRNYRLHLRLEQDGSGILIVNAATILHLNQTAAEYAYYLVKNVPVAEAARKMASRYHVSEELARHDYEELTGRIQTLIETPDLDPVTFLDFERTTPFSGSISAPYRLDCAVTYGLPAEVAAEAAPGDRVSRELTKEEWKTVIDKAWAAGIPHIVFTGGEPTLRQDLPELIARAEANSQVTGLLTDGLRLSDFAYLDSLLQTGLDHLMLIFQPENEESWTVLENVMAADLFVAVHVTIREQNQAEVPALLERLAAMGVPAISLSVADKALAPALQAAREQVARQQQELVWNLPVPYSALHPIALETASAEKIEGAGRAWLYVEPDGDVLPGQGINQVLGNFLRDSWEKIWKAK
jgi:organic radical activating enzyme